MAFMDIPKTPDIDRAVVWRCAAVVLIPVLFWATDRLLYDYVPDAAAELAYEVRIHRFTGEACLLFSKAPAPAELKDLEC